MPPVGFFFVYNHDFINFSTICKMLMYTPVLTTFDLSCVLLNRVSYSSCPSLEVCNGFARHSVMVHLGSFTFCLIHRCGCHLRVPTDICRPLSLWVHILVHWGLPDSLGVASRVCAHIDTSM